MKLGNITLNVDFFYLRLKIKPNPWKIISPQLKYRNTLTEVWELTLLLSFVIEHFFIINSFGGPIINDYFKIRERF